MSLKHQLKNILGERNLGRLDYFTKPELKNIWGGAFNGQEFRRRMFKQVCDQLSFQLIVETGAFRGNSTAFMASSGVPIKTVEFDSRIYGYVSTRFLFNRQISVEQNDSRDFLKRLAADASIPKQQVFFYLDAHWHDDLPLAEELAIIFGAWQAPVVMIDDFEVPGTNYDFDDYGEGKAITLEYVSKVSGAEKFHYFFPAADDTDETGFKRGSVVLCNDDKNAETLAQCDSLRRYSPD